MLFSHSFTFVTLLLSVSARPSDHAHNKFHGARQVNSTITSSNVTVVISNGTSPVPTLTVLPISGGSSAGTAPGGSGSSGSGAPGTGSAGGVPSGNGGSGQGSSGTYAPGVVSGNTSPAGSSQGSTGSSGTSGSGTGSGTSSGGSSSGGSTNPPYPVTNTTCYYWMENIKHQGIAAFNSDTDYQVFRNVKDFGAKGDGVTDDTAAINSAISSGGRCAPGSCGSSTTTPAVVYFPTGTYLISSSIIDYYYTQLIGNPNCLPKIVGSSNFTGLGLIDGDPYQLGSDGNLPFGATNTFWRQVRNFVIDMTQVPSTLYVAGVHWPTAQATSLQNMVFEMSTASGTQHMGVFIESGSGGFMNDLTFYGGLYGGNFGNQQFTMRNFSINNAVTGINQLWDWGWTYKSMSINNCTVGLNMSSGGASSQAVDSVTFIDSDITDTPIGIQTAHDPSNATFSAGSLVLENVDLNNVPIAIQGPNGTALVGTTGTATIAAWGEGHEYIPTGPVNFEGPIAPNARPSVLLSGSKYYERSKPQYANLLTSSFLSVRSAGAAGDGVTDDTAALQQVITTAAAQSQVVFFDAGTYKVTGTLYMPANSKWVGESYSVLMASGSFFSDVNSPQPLVQVGKSGETGSVEWSDMIVSTQGGAAGTVLIEWNLASSSTSPSGMWDVHSRVGGFAGSDLQVAQCPTTPSTMTPPAAIDSNCIAAFMTMHVTTSASGLYMENVWLWTADHDVEDPNETQITVYNGRGLYVESTAGTFWLVGTAVEHHTLYQYQFANTQNIFGGQYQTETPYYQPNPNATYPFSPVSSLNDPDFASICAQSTSGNCADAWAMRIISSSNILTYGGGFYSFFDNYSTTCDPITAGAYCQTNIISLEGTSANNPASAVNFYNLNTIGAQCMVSSPSVGNTATFANGTGAGINCYAVYDDNVEGFNSGIAVFRS